MSKLILTETQQQQLTQAFQSSLSYKANSFKWIASSEAPESYKELKEQYKAGLVRIADYGCEKSIYGSATLNILFRAHHDSLHCFKGYNFSLSGEIKTAEAQKKELKMLGLPEDVAELVYLDVVAQAWYYDITKKFVDDQQHFMHVFMQYSKVNGGYNNVIGGVGAIVRVMAAHKDNY